MYVWMYVGYAGMWEERRVGLELMGNENLGCGNKTSTLKSG